MRADNFTLDLQRGFLETAVEDCERMMGKLDWDLQKDLFNWYAGRLSVWKMLLEWHKKEHNND